jgi:peptide/nickel transport system permease protein
VLRVASRILWAIATIVAIPTLTFLFWTFQVERGTWNFVDVRGASVLDRLGGYLDATFLHLRLGKSTSLSQEPIALILRQGLPADLWVLAGGLVIGVALGLAGGLAAARNVPGPRVLSAFALSFPPYVFGLFALLLFAPFSGRFPVSFVSGSGSYAPLLHHPVSWLRSLWVPWLCLAAPLAASVLRMTDRSLRAVSDEPFLRTARAKGLSERVLLWRHALPAAAPPVVSAIGASMAITVLNLTLVEAVFNIPGALRHVPDAVTRLDLPLVQGLVLVITALVVTGNLAADLVLMRLRRRR